MFYEKEKSRKGCSAVPFATCQFSDVVKLIPECGNSICGGCHDQLRERASGTCQPSTPAEACGEGDHVYAYEMDLAQHQEA